MDLHHRLSPKLGAQALGSGGQVADAPYSLLSKTQSRYPYNIIIIILSPPVEFMEDKRPHRTYFQAQETAYNTGNST